MSQSAPEGLAALLVPFGGAAGSGNDHDHALPRLADVDRLGGKGAGLVKLVRLGLPVPGGVILTSELCEKLRAHLRSSSARSIEKGQDWLPEPLWQELWPALRRELSKVEAAARDSALARRAGPVLWAVRSSPRDSAPGLLFTLLNLGLSVESVLELAAATGDRRAALDCYRRLLSQWALMVHGVRIGFASSGFSEPLPAPTTDAELRAQALGFERELRQRASLEVPSSLEAQLRGALFAVLHSFERPAVRDFRRLQGLSDEVPGAVVIQAMVLGNLGPDSAAGVAFTRDPATGAPGLFGEFLESAQGEDIVAGSHTPRPLSELAARKPALYRELSAHCLRIEAAEGDLQDIEFGIERGQLYFLQTRAGRRSARAMVRIACDLVREGALSPESALLRIDSQRLLELQRPRLLPLPPSAHADSARPLLCQGLPASPGVVVGQVVLSVAEVEQAARLGEAPILVRTDTSTDDIIGIKLAAGVLTARGGLTSHAAVVARGLGRCAVVGASTLRIDVAAQSISGREHTVRRGELLTLDGHTGEVFVGAQPLILPELSSDAELSQLLAWSSERRRLRVRALAAPVASEFRRVRAACGDGVGLCRVESLFLGATARPLLDELLLRSGDDARGVRARLVAMLAQELHGVFRELPGRPVALRLFDTASALSWLEIHGRAPALAAALQKDETRSRLWSIELEAVQSAAALAQPGTEPALSILLPISDENETPRLSEVRELHSAAFGASASGPRIGALIPTTFTGSLAALHCAESIGIVCQGSVRAKSPTDAQDAFFALIDKVRMALPGVSELGLADPGPTGLMADWVARCERAGLAFVTAPAEALLGAQVAAAQAAAQMARSGDAGSTSATART